MASVSRAIDFQGMWLNRDEIQDRDRQMHRCPAEQLEVNISPPHTGARTPEDVFEKGRVSSRRKAERGYQGLITDSPKVTFHSLPFEAHASCLLSIDLAPPFLISPASSQASPLLNPTFPCYEVRL